MIPICLAVFQASDEPTTHRTRVSGNGMDKQQYSRIINVAACWGHIICIQNYNHRNYVLYNSKTTDLHFHGWMVEKMKQWDTWKRSRGHCRSVSEWLWSYGSRVNFCLRCKQRERIVMKSRPVESSRKMSFITETLGFIPFYIWIPR